MLRVSKYNIYLPFKKNPEKSLIIQGLSGSFDVVDTLVINTLKSAEKNIDCLERLPVEAIDALMQRGYVTKLSKEKEFQVIEKVISAINDQRKKILHLVILPTYSCNFRCSYCFEYQEKGCLKKVGANLLKNKMSAEVLNAIFAQVMKYRKDGYIINDIAIFGGEPLLKGNRDVILQICEKARHLNLEITCTSNGYDLDSYIDIIKAYDFKNIQITIDGVSEVHDSRRYLANKAGTYDKIVSNVDLALKAGLKIVIRTNVNANNAEEIIRLMEVYEDRGWTEYSNFKYYFQTTLACYEDSESLLTNIDLTKRLTEDFGYDMDKINLNGSYKRIAKTIKGMLDRKGLAPLKSSYCGAHTGMYVVDPFGDIYPCYATLGDKKTVIGKVDVENEVFLFNETMKVWKDRTVDKIAGCRNCKYMLFCGGGCAAEGKVVNDDYYQSYCNNFREMFNQVAVDVCEEHLNSHHI